MAVDLLGALKLLFICSNTYINAFLSNPKFVMNLKKQKYLCDGTYVETFTYDLLLKLISHYRHNVPIVWMHKILQNAIICADIGLTMTDQNQQLPMMWTLFARCWAIKLPKMCRSRYTGVLNRWIVWFSPNLMVRIVDQLLMWLALKLLSRRLYFALVSSSWSHQAKSGPLQAGLSNAYAVVSSDDDRRPSHLGGASSSIRTTWSSQRNRWLLIRLATYMSLQSSYSYRLVRIR